MRKLAYSNQPEVITNVSDVSLRSDLAAFLPAIIAVFESHADDWLDPILRQITSLQLREFYGSQPTSDAALPGVMFGAPERFGLDFDPLRGASAEYVFDAAQARQAIELILEILQSQMSAQPQYFGGIGVRFVKAGRGAARVPGRIQGRVAGRRARGAQRVRALPALAESPVRAGATRIRAGPGRPS